jgi:hypothetical protein
LIGGERSRLDARSECPATEIQEVSDRKEFKFFKKRNPTHYGTKLIVIGWSNSKIKSPDTSP